MTNSSDEAAEQGIADEQLPEDLRRSDDNPLAEPLDEDDVDVDALDMDGGKTPVETDDDRDSDRDDEELED